MAASIRTRYAALAAAGEIESDAGQLLVVERMAELERRLVEHARANKSSALGWLFGRREARAPIKGLYLHGEVGRGKTMMMDLFYETTSVERKRRAHFHEFMADVHERLGALRQDKDEADPIARAADAIAAETWLLCFDEFHVTDIADAMILGRLFTRLFELGVVMVATSNIAPAELYKDGLNRALFVPFIKLLEQHVEVIRLDARTDFRLEKLTGVQAWYVPADAEADAALDETWKKLTGGSAYAPCDLTVKGHTVHVPKAVMGVARFDFADLCAKPLGASDYLRIAHEFHTLLIDRIPVMGYERRNEAKRFIILVDTLYDHAVKLVASADTGPDALYTADEGYEALEFKRAASRLFEMRSQSYLGLPHGPRGGNDRDLSRIVDT